MRQMTIEGHIVIDNPEGLAGNQGARAAKKGAGKIAADQQPVAIL